MRSSLKTFVFAAAALGAVALGSAGASAAPMNGLAPSVEASTSANVEQARIVCGPYRCFRRPNFYGPRPYYRPYGFYGRPRGFYGRPYGFGYRRF